MNSKIFLSLALAVAALGCSSSGSGASPGGSDDAGGTGTPSNDASTSNSADSSTSTSNDAGNGNENPDSSTTTGSDDSGNGNQSPDSSTSTGPDASSDDHDSGATDAGAGDTGASSGDAGPLSFATDIYTPIIAVHCVGCHGGTGPGVSEGKLDMSTATTAYSNLVSVTSTGAACGSTNEVRVVPGNAADSLLYQKVNGFTTAPPCGNPMPASGEIANGGQAVVVQQVMTWINQGAEP